MQRLTFWRVFKKSTMIVVAWRHFEVNFAACLTLRVAGYYFQDTVVVLARLGDVQMPHTVVSQLVARSLHF